MKNTQITIRSAAEDDLEAILNILRAVVATGDTYSYAPDSSDELLLSYWWGSGAHTYVAVLEGRVVGTFVIKNNQPGLGAHIANGSYMTSPEFFGKGIGTAMGMHSLVEAKRHGFHAMQFNLVVKSNEVAVKLWQKIGFEIIGEIPDAFAHKKLGLTNAYIMYKKL